MCACRGNCGDSRFHGERLLLFWLVPRLSRVWYNVCDQNETATQSLIYDSDIFCQKLYSFIPPSSRVAYISDPMHIATNSYFKKKNLNPFWAFVVWLTEYVHRATTKPPKRIHNGISWLMTFITFFFRNGTDFVHDRATESHGKANRRISHFFLPTFYSHRVRLGSAFKLTKKINFVASVFLQSKKKIIIIYLLDHFSCLGNSG